MNKLKCISVLSPGRINIIGEHTDYNEGFVLPAAIDKGTIFNLTKNNTDNLVRITASNIHEKFQFDLTSFRPIKNGWENYVMGVVHELQKMGALLSGFDGEFSGTVPIGSGMSSSAALECSLAYGLNELFDLSLNKMQLIKACQMAEHNFVGIECGIMDQFASVMGKKDQVLLLDCRTLDYKYFPLELGNYQLLLLNTNVSHSLATSEYNARRAECEEGVSILQKIESGSSIQSLRDVSLNTLLKNEESLSNKIFQRCRHVIMENNRVILATEALEKGNFDEVGQLMYKSHFSLQNDYEVSCPELDFLVRQTIDKDYVPGSRMMGGGFGGCTINIVEQKYALQFTEEIAKKYYQEFRINITPYSVSVANGTAVIK